MPGSSCLRRARLLALSFAGFAWSQAAIAADAVFASAAPSQAVPLPAAMPFAIEINGNEQAEPSLVALLDGRVMVRASDLAGWGLGAMAMPAPRLAIGGEHYVDISGIAGLVARASAGEARLVVSADPSLFGQRRLAGEEERPAAVSRPVMAAYLDYDLTVTDWNGVTAATAFVNPGISGAWGVLDSTWLAGSDTGVRRLETAYIRDFPTSRLRLVLGDSTTIGTALSQPVRFGGVRIGTDFSLDPGYRINPLVALSGEAALPSTVELLSAGRRQSLSADAGRFTLDYRPQFNGAGTVTMVLRDLAGREQFVRRRFYSSASLLRAGTWAWSAEGGLLREDYGLRSFGYGTPFAAASARTGLTDTLTLASRASVSSHFASAEGGLTFVVPVLGQFDVSGAISRTAGNTGTAIRGQFQRITRTYAVSASYARSSSEFAQLGATNRRRGGREEIAAAAQVPFGPLGSLNLGFARLREPDNSWQAMTTGWTGEIGRAFLTVEARLSEEESRRAKGLFASLTIPIGTSRTASLEAGSDRMAAQLRQTVPRDYGVGFGIVAGRERGHGSMLLQGNVTVATPVGRIEAQAMRRAGSSGLQVGVSGSLVYAGGHLAAAPRLDYGIALVDLVGDASVTLMVENRRVGGRIGGGRRLVVTGLVPYAENHLSIQSDELPLSQVANLGDRVVVPGWRQAARVTFGEKPVHPLRLRLVRGDGTVVPPGQQVMAASGMASVTGYDGEVYLPDQVEPTELHVRGVDGACRAQVVPPPGDTLEHPLEVTCAPD